MPYTPIPAKANGQPVTANEWNTYLRDNLAFLYNGQVTRSPQLYTSGAKTLSFVDPAAYQDIDASLSVTIRNLLNKRLELILTATLTAVSTGAVDFGMSVAGADTLVFRAIAPAAGVFAYPVCVHFLTDPLAGSVTVKPRVQLSSAGSANLWYVQFTVVG